jgi:hypothetical protein
VFRCFPSRWPSTYPAAAARSPRSGQASATPSAAVSAGECSGVCVGASSGSDARSASAWSWTGKRPRHRSPPNGGPDGITAPSLRYDLCRRRRRHGQHRQTRAVAPTSCIEGGRSRDILQWAGSRHERVKPIATVICPVRKRPPVYVWRGYGRRPLPYCLRSFAAFHTADALSRQASEQ